MRATFEVACKINADMLSALEGELTDEAAQAIYAKRDTALAAVGWTFDEVINEAERRATAELDEAEVAEAPSSKPKYEVHAEYVDTCLSCYLQDGYSRPGEWLLCFPPYGQTVDEAVSELYNQMQGESPPEDFENAFDTWPEDAIRAAFREELEGVDLRFLDGGGDPVNKEAMTDECTYEDESPYVYVVLRWSKVSK